MTKNITELGILMKKYRVDHGLTQDEFGIGIGYSGSFVSQVEKCERRASKKFLRLVYAKHPKCIHHFDLSRTMIRRSQPSIVINMKGLTQEKRSLLVEISDIIHALREGEVKEIRGTVAGIRKWLDKVFGEEENASE